MSLGVTGKLAAAMLGLGNPRPLVVVNGKEAFERGLADFARNIELVPRHTYLYCAKENIVPEHAKPVRKIYAHLRDNTT
eukprot:7710649-Pyramimonas_sp.AAC.1